MTSKSRLCLCSLALTWALSPQGGKAQEAVRSDAPAQLTYSISEREGACDRPVALKLGARVTLNFPSPVRVSVPSHDQQLELFISGRLVVVSAAPQRQAARQAPEEALVSVTTELKSGETFICSFLINPPSSEQRPRDPAKLIRIISTASERRLEREAIQLIKLRLKALRSEERGQRRESPYPELDEMLSASWERANRHALDQALGSQRLQISDGRPIRAQEHLIYVTLDRVLVSERRVYLRALLRNRSQRIFELQEVFYIPVGETRPVLIWSRSQRDQEDESRDELSLRVPPDAREYPLVLTANLSLLEASSLVFVGDRERDVVIDLDALDELR